MSFYKKYELQRLIHEFDAKVFRAVQNSTGAQVLLHVFPATDSARAVAAEAQKRIDGGGAIELIETGEFAGSLYVVTVPIEGIENLRAYLQSSRAAAVAQPAAPAPPAPEAPPPPPVPSPPPPAPSAAPMPNMPAPAPPPPAQQPPAALTDTPSPKPKRRTSQIISHGSVTVHTSTADPRSAPLEVGEFTRLFGGAAPAPTPATPPPAPQPPAAAPPQQTAGEFTQMFHGMGMEAPQPPPAAAPPPPPKTEAPPPPPPPRARDQEMDDFEKIFGPAGGRPFPADEPAKTARPESPLPAWPQAPPAPGPSAQARESEFTNFFGSAFHGAEIDIDAEHKRAAAEPKTDSRRPFQQASEFTRMFGTDDPAKHPPQPQMPLPGQTHASTMFGSAQQLQQAAASLTGAPEASAGPGEYTRLIGGAPGPSAPGAGLNEDSVSLKSGAMPAVAASPRQAPGQNPPPVQRGSNIGLYIAVAAIVLSLLAAIILLLKSR